MTDKKSEFRVTCKFDFPYEALIQTHVTKNYDALSPGPYTNKRKNTKDPEVTITKKKKKKME